MLEEQLWHNPQTALNAIISGLPEVPSHSAFTSASLLLSSVSGTQEVPSEKFCKILIAKEKVPTSFCK